MTFADPLKALFYPLESGALAPAGRALFINARVCEGLSGVPRESALMLQHFKPWADDLARAGYKTAPDIPAGTFDLVLLHTPRQQEEARHDLAAGLLALAPGGTLIAAAANDAGGKRLKKEARAFGFECSEDSRHKSRVILGVRGAIDEEQCKQAVAAGGYRSVCGGDYTSRPGVFSWDRVDAGSALLARHIPAGALRGRGADFGCGFGYLALQALKNNPGITEISCIDADARAVESCRRNMPSGAKVQFIWADIARRGSRDLPHNLDWIVMNPPFHEGARAVPEAGIGFIAAARECLRPGGSLWMVANSHLPYERALAENFSTVAKAHEGQGYKIFHAA